MKIFYLVLCLLICGCAKPTTINKDYKTTAYAQTKEGLVFYISAPCFDYPMGDEAGRRVFRDGTVHELLKDDHRKDISWDDYNKWCEDYFRRSP